MPYTLPHFLVPRIALLSATTLLALPLQSALVEGWQGVDGNYWKVPSAAEDASSIQRIAYKGTRAGSVMTLDQEGSVPVIAGERYFATANAIARGSFGNHLQSIAVNLYDRSGNLIEKLQSQWVYGHAGETSVVLEFTAPPQATSASLQVAVKVTEDLDNNTYLIFNQAGIWTESEWLAKLKAREDYLESIRFVGPEPEPVLFDPEDWGAVTEGSLSVGKFYRFSRPPHPDYPDRLPSRWSDGVILTDDPREHESHVAWSGTEPIAITVDLGRLQTLQEASMEGYVDDGRHAPHSITVETRLENDSPWTPWGQSQPDINVEDNLWKWSSSGKDQPARYIRLTVTPAPQAEKGLTSIAHLDLNGLIKNTWKRVPSEGALHGAFPTAVGFSEDVLQGRRGMVIDLFEELVGKKLAIVLWYQKLAKGRPFSEIQRLREDELSRNYYGQRYLSIGWEPESSIAIANGELDDHLEQYFRDSIDPAITRGISDPIWFRPMGEFNGGWVKYGLDPVNFRRAWRRLYNIAEQTGALDTHILVWAPNHLSYPDEPWNQPEMYWPGDQYVDWVGISAYPMSPKFAKTPDSYYPVENIAQVYNLYADYKPLMIVEGGFNDRIDRERFVYEWFEGIKNERPNLKILIWENHNERVISRSPEALELYRKLVQDPYWISETWTGSGE